MDPVEINRSNDAYPFFIALTEHQNSLYTKSRPNLDFSRATHQGKAGPANPRIELSHHIFDIQVQMTTIPVSKTPKALVVIGAYLLIASACGGGGDGGGGENPTPSELIKVSGDSQVVEVNKTIPLSLVVKVLDGSGTPMSGVSVVFTVTSGAGNLAGTTSVTVATDHSGLAGVSTWKVGSNAAGDDAVRASVTGVAPIVFHAIGEPGLPAILSKLTGDQQTGVVNAVLPDSLSVRVSDAFANHVGAGVTVTFAITSGGGMLANLTAITDTAGVAVARQWRLGTVVGVNTVQASVATINAFFGATGVHGQLAVVTPTGDGQSGTSGEVLPLPLELVASDQYGNPVAQVPVTWQVTGGGGTLAPGAPETDAAGRVTAPWTLGLIIAPNSATATVAGFSPFVFNAPGTAFTTATLDAGSGHSCALAPSGEAYCWGLNDQGQTGQPIATAPLVLIPTLVPNSPIFTRVFAGGAFSCGLSATGVASCWGSNNVGQLGDGTFTNRTTPVLVTGSHVFDSLYAGYKHTCGLMSSGAAYCWGDGASGQIGDGLQLSRSSPTLVTGNHTFVSLALREDGTCGIVTGGSVFCWGLSYGAVPVAAGGGIAFTSITSGALHTCGHSTGGADYCWGDNSQGQLGNPAGGGPIPIVVQGGLVFSQLAAGASFTCGLSGSDIYCWGQNDEGQSSAVPVKVNAPLTFSFVSPGSHFTCAIGNMSAVYCWGRNFGSLGDGTLLSRIAVGAVDRPPGY
jgi:Bacterial Ig-like domain (group 1)/Regulator of chromosome condensation (RCC1) repeat